MKIGDVANRLDLSVQTLRFYEREGLLNARRSAGGTRVYNSDDVERIIAIRNLGKLGIPLQQIKQLANTRLASSTGNEASHAVAGQLQSIANTLLQLKTQIDQTLADIQQAHNLVVQCFDCNEKPIRSGCATCPVADNLNQAQLLQLIWDQDYADQK